MSEEIKEKKKVPFLRLENPPENFVRKVGPAFMFEVLGELDIIKNNPFYFEFLKSNAEREEKYKDRTFYSDKQKQVLDKLAYKFKDLLSKPAAKMKEKKDYSNDGFDDGLGDDGVPF